MADGWDTLAMGTGAVSIVLGLFLLARGLRSPSRWVLAGLLIDFGLVAILEILPGTLGGQWTAPMRTTLFVLRSLFISLNLAFAIVFPSFTISPARKLLLALAFAPSAIVALAALTDPSLVPRSLDAPTDFSRLVNLLIVASHFPALWTFGRYWLTAPASSYRSQFLYVLLAYLLWNATDALHALVDTFLHPERYGFALLGTAFLLSLGQLLALLIIGLGSLIRSAMPSRDVWREDLRLVLLLLLVVPFAILLFSASSGAHLVDGLIMPILFYGGARFQVPELYVRIKTGVAAGFLGAVGVGILFVVEEAIQLWVGNEFGSRFGFLGGLGVALLTLAAFAPLRGLARRFSNRILPDVQSDPEYWTQRRLDLYRVALEGILKDRTVHPAESRVLERLREELRVSPQEHATLEAALRGGPLVEFRTARRVQ